MPTMDGVKETCTIIVMNTNITNVGLGIQNVGLGIQNVGKNHP